MPEVRSFESFSATQIPPSFERNFVSPEMVNSVRMNAQITRSLYECHVSKERKEAADCIALMELALADATNGISVMTGRERQATLNTPEKVPASKPPESSQDRKKIATYGNLADLAYVDFVRSPEVVKSGRLEVSWVVLDPLSFPNIRNIETAPDENLTENEQELRKFLKKNPPESFRWNLANFDSTPVSRDASELLYIASSGKFDQSGIATKMAMRRGIPEQNANTVWGIDRGTITDGIAPDYSPKYASIDPKYRSTMIDADPSTYVFPRETDIPKSSLSETEKLQVLRINAGLEHVRQFKAQESSKLFENLQKEWYSVIDHFPDAEAKDSESSGFSAIAVKDKAGKMHIAVRGTELTDFWDIGADFKLMIGRLPENQTRDLITFMDRNLAKLPPWEKVRIIGHSLGGALTQLASVMYDERVEESYTYNSPGAKKLAVNPKLQPDEMRPKFEKYANFGYTNDSASVENRIVNVAGSKWPSLIANLGNDVGFYKIELKEPQSHSITKLVKEVSKETTELKLVDTRKKDSEKIQSDQ